MLTEKGILKHEKPTGGMPLQNGVRPTGRYAALEEIAAAACLCMRTGLTSPKVSMALTAMCLASSFKNVSAICCQPLRVDMGTGTSRDLAFSVMKASYLPNFEALAAFKEINVLKQRTFRFEGARGFTNVKSKK